MVLLVCEVIIAITINAAFSAGDVAVSATSAPVIITIAIVQY